jgi:ABC-type protease/lipase transport system fused ATPase/permease subunit
MQSSPLAAINSRQMLIYLRLLVAGFMKRSPVVRMYLDVDKRPASPPDKLSVMDLSSFKNIRMTMVTACLLINLLGLAFPLLMLQLYDRILPSQSLNTLFLFLTAVLVAILLEGVLIAARASLVSWLGAKFEHAAMMHIMSRFLN